MNAICGVYIIRNTITGECYVGASRNVKVRWTEHRCLLHRNMGNKRLQAAFNLCGKEAFEFKLLEECAAEDLQQKELEWAYKLNPQLNNMVVVMDKGKLFWKRTQDLKQEASIRAIRQWQRFKAHAKNRKANDCQA